MNDNSYYNQPGSGSNDDQPVDQEQLATELAALSVAELKRLMVEQGLDFRNCLEKSDLIAKLLLAAQSLPNGAAQQPYNSAENVNQHIVVHHPRPQPQRQDAYYIGGDPYGGDGYYHQNDQNDNPEAPFADDYDKSEEDDSKKTSKTASWASSRWCRLLRNACVMVVLLVVVFSIVYLLEFAGDDDDDDDDGEGNRNSTANNNNTNIFIPAVPTLTPTISAAPSIPTTLLPTTKPTETRLTTAPSTTLTPTTSITTLTPTTIPTPEMTVTPSLPLEWTDQDYPLEAGQMKALSSNGRTLVALGWNDSNKNDAPMIQVWTFVAANSESNATVTEQWQRLGQDLVTNKRYGDDENTDYDTEFGSSVAISADGRIVAIGTETRLLVNEGSPLPGHVEVFVYSENQSTKHERKLTASAGQWNAMGDIVEGWDAGFGTSVALSANGNVLAARSLGSLATWRWNASAQAWQPRGETFTLRDLVLLLGEKWQDEYDPDYDVLGEDKEYVAFQGPVVLSADGQTLAVGMTHTKLESSMVPSTMSPFPVSVFDWDELSQMWQVRPGGPYVNKTETGVDSAWISPFGLSEDGSRIATSIFHESARSSGYQVIVWEWDNRAVTWNQLGGTLGGTGDQLNHDWLEGMALSANGKTVLGETSRDSLYSSEIETTVTEVLVRAFRYEINVDDSTYQWKKAGDDLRANTLFTTLGRVALSGDGKTAAVGWSTEQMYHPNSTTYIKVSTLEPVVVSPPPATTTPVATPRPAPSLTPTIHPSIFPSNFSSLTPTEEGEERTTAPTNVSEAPSAPPLPNATEAPSINAVGIEN